MIAHCVTSTVGKQFGYEGGDAQVLDNRFVGANLAQIEVNSLCSLAQPHRREPKRLPNRDDAHFRNALS